MKKFKENNKIRNILESWPSLFILTVIILIFGYNLVVFFGKMQDTQNNKEIVQNKIIELEKNKEKLETDILNLQTNAGIEENIRENFGLAKQGEEVIVIVPNTDKVEEKKTEGFWEKVLSWFK